MGVSGQHHAPAAFTPGKDPVPIIQEAEWAPGPVWTNAENFAPPGFDPRTPHPVASRYTDYAITAPGVECGGAKNSDNRAILPNHKTASLWIQREVPQGQHIPEQHLLF